MKKNCFALHAFLKARFLMYFIFFEIPSWLRAREIIVFRHNFGRSMITAGAATDPDLNFEGFGVGFK